MIGHAQLGARTEAHDGFSSGRAGGSTGPATTLRRKSTRPVVQVYNASGYPDMVSKADAYGQHFTKIAHWLSHEASPRASIFRRDQAAVRDVRSMARLMRSNDWEHDPVGVLGGRANGGVH